MGYQSTKYGYIFSTQNIYCITVMIYLSISSVIIINGQSIKAQFNITTQNNSQYGNMIVDNLTGYVYLGLMNELHHLDSNLIKINWVSTGPQLDDPACLDPGYFGQSTCSLTSKPVSTSNFNQILVIDSKRQNLITCGTLYQGTCQTRKLNNITNYTDFRSSFTQFVASNLVDFPTVSFVGPGPFGDDVLYVASSLTAAINPQQWFSRRNSDGVVSSRYLGLSDPTFNTYEVSQVSGAPTIYVSGTNAALTQTAAATKYFNYVAGFGVNGFSYFFSYSVDASFSSRIVQVCQNDRYFETYVDMKITCGNFENIQSATWLRPSAVLMTNWGLGTTELIVLAVFTSTASADSAICAYKLSDIRNRFTDNIKLCNTNSGVSISTLYQQGPGNSGISGRLCTPSANANITQDWCGGSATQSQYTGINSPLSGQLSLNGSLLLTIPNTQLTGITSSMTGSHNVLFLGTSTGVLKKVLFDSIYNVVSYQDLLIDTSGSAINKDMIVSYDNNFLYLMSAKSVYKVSVSDCGSFTTCGACIGANDPYCGWCILQNSCRLKADCPNSSMNNQWQSVDSLPSPMCVSVTNAVPNKSDITQTPSITLTIPALPAPPSNQQYICVFDYIINSPNSTIAVYSAGQLVCSAPATKPFIAPETNCTIVNISIRLSSGTFDLAKYPYYFYSCGSYSSCSSCINSQWGTCRWCISSSVCQDSALSCTTTPLSTSASCPSLSQSSAEVILIPAGISQSITLNALNLLAIPNGATFYCVLLSSSTDLSSSKISASRNSATSITCSPFSYTSTLKTPQSMNLVTTWENNYRIDSSYSVTVFNCSAISEGDCNTCLSLNGTASMSRYNCVWCGTNCASTCQTPTTQCPAPVLTGIIPKSGPLEGGTSLTILGTNLGYTSTQVAVTVGGVSCPGTANNVSKQYVCITPPGTKGSSVVSVHVSARTGQSQSLTGEFVYQDPQLNSIIPVIGPMNGGTALTIGGTLLDTGASISILLNTYPCLFDMGQSNSSQIVCLTSPVSNPTTINNVAASFDGSTRNLSTSFKYTANPSILSIYPSTSFSGGGCIITVNGSDLQSGLDAYMTFTPNLQQISPSNRSSDQMMFKTPKVTPPSNGGSSSPYNISVVVDSNHVISQNQTFSLTFYPDPVFDKFDPSGKPYNGNGDPLQITGTGFMQPCVVDSIIIHVGPYLCNISSITPTNIICLPPIVLSELTQPSGIPVTVNVGDIVVSIGTLYSNTGLQNYIWQIAVGVISGILLINIVILIRISCMYEQRKPQSSKDPISYRGNLDTNTTGMSVVKSDPTYATLDFRRSDENSYSHPATAVDNTHGYDGLVISNFHVYHDIDQPHIHVRLDDAAYRRWI